MFKKLRPALRAAFAVAAVSVATGCESGLEPGPELTSLPRALTAAEQEVIGSSNAFAFNLLRQLAGPTADENVSISPLSVSMALGMTMNGAAGTTWDEMRDVLGFRGLDQDEINESYRGLIDLLLDLDPATEVTIANSIWHHQDFPFEQTFLDVVTRNFDAEVTALDLRSPQAASRINRWVSDATRGRIPTIVEEVDSSKVMYLINAIYFNGLWRQRFDEADTRDGAFTTASGSVKQVPMMTVEGEFAHSWQRDFVLVDLPYGNGAFSMTILLPHEDVDLGEVLADLDAEAWSAALGSLVERGTMVSMPRFRLEYEQGLIETLQALGMVQAFVPNGADLSRMSEGAGRLYISEVIHKTFMDVDEEGTEAAAATSVGVSVTSAPMGIRVDRPFLAVIRERLSGTVLFAASVGDPS